LLNVDLERLQPEPQVRAVKIEPAARNDKKARKTIEVEQE
jgi:hypothetical protein